MVTKIDVDKIMTEIEKSYAEYGTDDFLLIKKAYQYAQKSHS